jgi:hypothetical protein
VTNEGANSTTAVDLIRSFVSQSSRISEAAADVTPAQIDAVCEALGVSPGGTATVRPLLMASVEAFEADQALRSPTANSRCWSQWFFRMACRVCHVANSSSSALSLPISCISMGRHRRVLAGHPDSRTNPAKASFGFFGQCVPGDQTKESRPRYRPSSDFSPP